MNSNDKFVQQARLDAVPDMANKMRTALTMLPPAPAINHGKMQAVLSPVNTTTLGDILIGWRTLWDISIGGDGTPFQTDTPAGALWNGPALNLVKDSVEFARGEAASMSPMFLAEVDNYNAGKAVSPFFVGFFARLNAYYEQGQARAGKLTPQLAKAASAQWLQDSQRSGVWNTLDTVAKIGAAAVFGYAAYVAVTAPAVAAAPAPAAMAPAAEAPAVLAAAPTAAAAPAAVTVTTAETTASTVATVAKVAAGSTTGSGENVNTDIGGTINGWLQDAGVVMNSYGSIQQQQNKPATGAAQVVQPNGVMNTGISQTSIIMAVLGLLLIKVII